jgi:fermentation-respiration switch protein FrsA (DUF1100 family)
VNANRLTGLVFPWRNYHPEVYEKEKGAVVLSWLLPVAIVVGVLLVLWAAQRQLMYFPIDHVATPDSLGLADVESVTFDTADGLRLSGWFFPVAAGARGTVLVFNGNAGNRAYRAPLASALRRHGFQVLLADYRGFGGNPGAPTERALVSDARAALSYLTGRRDVDPARLIYFGESLGTAVAVNLAVEHPPAALILRSPFTSMADVGQHHYWWLPVRWLIRDRYDSLALIGRVRSPLLVIVGERDGIVPVEYSRGLYDAATYAPKTYLSVPGADHNDYELLAGDTMIEAIARFIGTPDGTAHE